MIRWSLVAIGLFAVGLGCSSGSDGKVSGGTGGVGTGGAAAGTGGSGGSGGGGGTAAALTYKPCDQAMRAGTFTIDLKRNEGSQPFTAFQGGVKNGIDPERVWQQLAQEGDCRLLVGRMLVCNTPCTGGKICAGSNMCVDEPTTQDTGTATISGLGAAKTFMFLPGQGYYGTWPLETPFPPFAQEVEIKLQTTAGKYGALSLAGRGITPLEFAGTGLNVARNQPLPVTWTPPARPGSARIHLGLDIAHHGGISARIECDVADTGSTTISASLVNQLMDRGLAGWPTLALTRQTADSVNVASGCVEFQVASSQERPVQVEGVTSCNDDRPCPGGKVCPANSRCE
jgi:hypothetical protein